MTAPANNDAALVREALEHGLQAWRGTDLREKFIDAFSALDRLAATAERAEALERQRDTARMMARSWAERVEPVEAALLAAQRERDERLTRESGLALIEDAQRWQEAYAKARDELAEAEATITRLREAMRQHWFSEILPGLDYEAAPPEGLPDWENPYWAWRDHPWFSLLGLTEDECVAALAQDAEQA